MENKKYLTPLLLLLIFVSCATWNNHVKLNLEKEILIDCRVEFINLRNEVVLSDLPDSVIEESLVPILEGITIKMNLLLEQAKTIKITNSEFEPWKARRDVVCNEIDTARQIFNKEKLKCLPQKSTP